MEIISVKDVTKYINDGDTLLIGGFLGVGSPDAIINEIIDSGKKDFTVVGNDTSFETNGIGRFVKEKKVKKIIASHIGTNPETQKQMIEESIEVELIPQGTLAEQIRAGGVGLGGILTPTGLGTVVEKNKTIVEVDGKKYLLEKPIRGNVAVIKAKKADKAGNLIYSFTARNFNPIMAMAADIVIAEVEEIIETGKINPDEIHTPGIFVDYIVLGGDEK